jgi:hypothetical protein
VTNSGQAKSWNYTGYGEVAILCDTINENQSFLITYNEKNPEATYLERTIEWNEIEVEKIIIKTEEIKIMEIEFVADRTAINVTCTNPGTTDVTIGTAKVNGDIVTISGTNTVAAGGLTELTLIQSWTAGNKYGIALFAVDGTLIDTYTDTA